MRFAPTALGLKGGVFFGAVLLSYFATPYSNLFFLLTAFLVVLAVLGVTGALRNLAGIRVEWVTAPPSPAEGRHEPELRVIAGARARFQVELLLDLDIAGERALRRATILSFAQGETQATGRLIGLPRGVHRVRAFVLSTCHPFGIVKATRRLPADAELVVHPRPADLRGDARGGADGLDGDLLRGPGDEAIAGLRPYRDGDSLRAVHWKATARRGAPVLKEYERETGDGLEVVLDRRAPSEEFEHALALATALLLAAQESERPMRLCSQRHDGVYGAGHAAVADGLRWLAAATPLPADAEPPPPATTTAIRLPRPRARRAAETTRA